MKQEPSQKEYNQYVKQVTPTHSLVKNCFHAFWIGGLICVIGQLFFQVERPYFLSIGCAHFV